MTLWSDLRYSVRSLARTPGVTLALLLTIALGIGSNAAVVGFVRGLVTRDLPVPRADSIVSLYARDSQDAFGAVSYDTYLSVKDHSAVFDLLGAVRESRAGVMIDGRSSVMAVAAVTPAVASLLQFSTADGIVISHRVWQTEFGGKADVRGARLTIDAGDVQVGGVAPQWLEGLHLGNDVDLWVPFDESATLRDRSSRTCWVLGRLKPGVSQHRAQADVNSSRSGADVLAVLPYTGMTPEVSTGMVRLGRLLTAAAGAVFLIACANVGTLLLSRASARSRETAVRVGLGASRPRLASQLLSDSLVISVTGGVFGMLLAVWTANLVPAFFFDQDAERLAFAPDLAGIVAASAACVGITVVCGLMPLMEIRHDDPATVLRRESAGPSIVMRRVRAGLVVAQMTCCCLLVISATSLFSGFRTALQTSMGARLRYAVLATVEARDRFERPDLGLQYFADIEKAALTVPRISEAAWSGKPPGGRPGWLTIRIEPPQLSMREITMDVAAFTPQSLKVVKVPPIAGRMFGGSDTAQSCRVVVVNEAAAEAFFDGDPVGRSIEDPEGERVEIIGVVAMRQPPDASQPVPPTVFYYAEQTATPHRREGPARFRIPRLPEATRGLVEANVVSASYFEVMELSPVAGKLFPHFAPPRSCRVAVINQEAAERYFGGHAVGGAVIDAAGRRTEIAGVVHPTRLRASQRRVEPAMYLPMTQDFLPGMTMILGSSDANGEMLASLRQQLAAVPGGMREPIVTTLDDHLRRTALAAERIAAVLVIASAATALALGVFGLYGAMAEAGRQRQREIAVRIALGAQGWRVIRQVLAEGAMLAGAGALAGLLGAIVVVRWLSRIMPNAGPINVWTWILAPLALGAAVTVACVVPARRALSVDPLVVMRDE
jgi:predicted permease